MRKLAARRLVADMPGAFREPRRTPTRLPVPPVSSFALACDLFGAARREADHQRLLRRRERRCEPVPRPRSVPQHRRHRPTRANSQLRLCRNARDHSLRCRFRQSPADIAELAQADPVAEASTTVGTAGRDARRRRDALPCRRPVPSLPRPQPHGCHFPAAELDDATCSPRRGCRCS